MSLEHEKLTERIIGAAINVHRSLGPGFIESIYENALVVEFLNEGIAFQQQIEIPVTYRDKLVGKHRLDLFVESLIVVELKVVVALEDIHFAIVRSYLRAANRHHGLLLNFAGRTLEIKRVIATS